MASKMSEEFPTSPSILPCQEKQQDLHYEYEYDSVLLRQKRKS